MAEFDKHKAIEGLSKIYHSLSNQSNSSFQSFFNDDDGGGTFKSIAEIHKIAANREWDAIRNSIDSDVFPVDGIYFKSVNPFFSVNMDKITDSGLFYVHHNEGNLYYTIKIDKRNEDMFINEFK